jgi:hypothetical protein
MMPTSLEIVQEWSDLLNKGDIEGAASLVADELYMKTPKGTVAGKEKWMEEVPTILKEGIAWEAFAQGTTDTQVVCDGTKKLGFLKVKILRTIELNENGKLVSIVFQKK